MKFYVLNIIIISIKLHDIAKRYDIRRKFADCKIAFYISNV